MMTRARGDQQQAGSERWKALGRAVAKARGGLVSAGWRWDTGGSQLCTWSSADGCCNPVGGHGQNGGRGVAGRGGVAAPTAGWDARVGCEPSGREGSGVGGGVGRGGG